VASLQWNKIDVASRTQRFVRKISQRERIIRTGRNSGQSRPHQRPRRASCLAQRPRNTITRSARRAIPAEAVMALHAAVRSIGAPCSDCKEAGKGRSGHKKGPPKRPQVKGGNAHEGSIVMTDASLRFYASWATGSEIHRNLRPDPNPSSGHCLNQFGELANELTELLGLLMNTEVFLLGSPGMLPSSTWDDATDQRFFRAN
jgi:hypothetical protein